MNTNQKANLDAAVSALGASLASAWSYFHLLRGMHCGSKQSPEVIERFGFLFDQLWRAIFDGFFAKVGTLIDNTKGTHSLPNLVKLLRRYGDADLKLLIPEVEDCLAKNSAFEKLRTWRHDAVAHNKPGWRSSDFYAANKMTLAEIEDSLEQLEVLLNHLSLGLLSIHNDTRNGTAGLVDDGMRLFS